MSTDGAFTAGPLTTGDAALFTDFYELTMAYKLVKYAGRNVAKLSPGKATWPDEKQVYRSRGSRGEALGDVLAARDEPPPEPGLEPLMRTVMAGGKPVEPLPPLAVLRERCAREIAALPEGVRRLHGAEAYPVRPSQRLVERRRALSAALEAAEIAGYRH